MKSRSLDAPVAPDKLLEGLETLHQWADLPIVRTTRSLLTPSLQQFPETPAAAQRCRSDRPRLLPAGGRPGGSEGWARHMAG